MKILSLGLDNSVFKKNSQLVRRVVKYGNLVDEYTIIVPDRENKEVKLSEQVQAYSVKSINKLVALYKIHSLAKKILNKEKYNIITVQDQYFLAFLGLMLAKKFQLGLEIQVHGFEKYYGLRKSMAKFVIPKANAIRTVSQRLKKELINDFGVEERIITVAPIYVEHITHNVEHITHNNDKVIFLTVGRLVPVKNIKMQIKAMSEVVKQYQNVELWIMGKGKEEKDLKFEIGNLGLKENVKLLGWQDDLKRFYSQADVFLLTSNYEGWGMAVIEAASYGLPIIMTDVGCAGEVIKDNKNGIVIPVNNQKALFKAMTRLIMDYKLRRKLGENARQAVLSLPSRKETLKLYKESWNKALIKYKRK